MMHLTATLSGTGFHPASWCAAPEGVMPSGRHFRGMARTAERGMLDAVLLGEPVGSAQLRASGRVNRLRIDPLPLLGSLIAVTSRIGLGAEWAVDYTEPYNVARVFATLDHLAGGRTAWIVRMFGGGEIASHFRHAALPRDMDEYCSRAIEFIDVVKKLWDSWEDEGFLLDVPTGRFADPQRVHPINHVGAAFSVRGPLNVPRPPQGNAVLMQWDRGIPAGRAVAARTADLFLTSPATSAEAADLYADMKAMAAAQGRAPGGLRILVNITPILAATDAMAARDAAELDDMMAPGLLKALVEDRLHWEPDAGPVDADRALAAIWPGRQAALAEHGLEPGMTLRAAGRQIAADRGVLRFVGTPAQFTDLMETWIRHGCCDGFNILPAVLPSGLDTVVDEVVPLLRARGLFRAAYHGDTLRAHLDLDRPRSRYAA